MVVVVTVQMAQRLFPTPEIRGSKPNTSKSFYCKKCVNCVEKMERNRDREGFKS